MPDDLEKQVYKRIEKEIEELKPKNICDYKFLRLHGWNKASALTVSNYGG